MIGRFGYKKNCSLLHHIPQGVVQDGCPVIVFPKNNHEAAEGETYDFILVMTRRATYTIDGDVYRVGHAMSLRNISGTEGDTLDVMMERFGKKDESGATLGDVAGGKLAQLRERLAAR